MTTIKITKYTKESNHMILSRSGKVYLFEYDKNSSEPKINRSIGVSPITHRAYAIGATKFVALDDGAKTCKVSII